MLSRGNLSCWGIQIVRNARKQSTAAAPAAASSTQMTVAARLKDLQRRIKIERFHGKVSAGRHVNPLLEQVSVPGDIRSAVQAVTVARARSPKLTRSTGDAFTKAVLRASESPAKALEVALDVFRHPKQKLIVSSGSSAQLMAAAGKGGSASDVQRVLSMVHERGVPLEQGLAFTAIKAALATKQPRLAIAVYLKRLLLRAGKFDNKCLHALCSGLLASPEPFGAFMQKAEGGKPGAAISKNGQELLDHINKLLTEGAKLSPSTKAAVSKLVEAVKSAPPADVGASAPPAADAGPTVSSDGPAKEGKDSKA